MSSGVQGDSFITISINFFMPCVTVPAVSMKKQREGVQEYKFTNIRRAWSIMSIIVNFNRISEDIIVFIAHQNPQYIMQYIIQ